MDVSYRDRNDASLAQLRALIARLNDADFARPLGDGWSVAVGLAHLAFWDRLAAALLDEWGREGFKPTGSPAGPINVAALPGWQAIPPRATAVEALAAADAVNRAVAAITPTLADEIVAGGRTRILDRSPHRRDHLAQIEAALAS